MAENVDPRSEQLAALEAAEKQQLDALAQHREVALESARYWENLTEQATAGLSEAQAALLPVPQPSPTVLTEAHFAYLESVLKAQATLTRTLLTGTADD